MTANNQLKGAVRSFGEDIHTLRYQWGSNTKSEIFIASIREQTSLFPEENEVPERCLKLERRQGPPHMNQFKQKLRCPYKSVGLSSLFRLQRISQWRSKTTQCSFNSLFAFWVIWHVRQRSAPVLVGHADPERSSLTSQHVCVLGLTHWEGQWISRSLCEAYVEPKRQKRG